MMFVRNIKDINDKDLLYCYDKNMKSFLDSKNILHINKGTDDKGTEYWCYLNSNILKEALEEYNQGR